MIGNTNALSVQKTEGGANKIYVENCTTLPVESGRQVLLNMTLTDEDLTLSYYSSGTNYYGIVLNNEIFTCGGNIRRFQAGSGQADVIGGVDVYCNHSVYLYMNPNTKKLQTILLNSYNVIEVSPAGSRKVSYFYLGDGLCLYDGAVYRCNEMEGVLRDIVYKLPIAFSIRNNFQGYAYIDKNLFVTSTTSIYQIDLSDLNDIRVVRSATGLGSVNYFHGFTGIEVGDYVLGRSGGSLVMYRLTETGFELIEESHPEIFSEEGDHSGN